MPRDVQESGDRFEERARCSAGRMEEKMRNVCPKSGSELIVSEGNASSGTTPTPKVIYRQGEIFSKKFGG